MWFTRPTPVMIEPHDALPGRDQAMPVRDAHRVLDTPLTPPFPDGHQVLYVAMGCFWGAERLYWQLPGVHTTAVGYMGGWTPNPTYEETCTGQTGHTETVLVSYDPAQVDLDILLKVFWENHDPTTLYQQGNDVGTQYRSAIYATTQDQLDAALASRDRYQAALDGAGQGQITTEILLADDAGDGTFWYAEDYHQQYLEVNPGGYCNHGFCQVAYGEAGEEPASAGQ